MSRVIDINVAKREQIWLPNCMMGHMTFIFKLDQANVKVNMHARNEDAASRYSRVIVLKGAKTDTQTKASENITSLAIAVGKESFIQTNTIRYDK